MARTAVVLFNLGGPDRPAAIRPFLFNLFNDPAILQIPQPFRWLLAQVISRRRAPKAGAIYDQMGGGSPLLPLTEDQARALEAALGGESKAFVAMRYWHPLTDAAAAAVKAWNPDRIVLLPLYPQFSTTTTGSSLTAWAQAARRVGLTAPTRIACCYPSEPGFVAAIASAIRPAFERAAQYGRPRLLFSAHGLPKKVIDAGDPYQWQVERSAAAVVETLTVPDLDWLVSYQSTVGPLAGLGPATDDEGRRAGRDRVPLVVVPIAFVSEHSETLVELDIEYRHLAETAGVPAYERVPAVGTAPEFIDGLAALVRRAMDSDGVISESGHRLCPATCGRCVQGRAS